MECTLKIMSKRVFKKLKINAMELSQKKKQDIIIVIVALFLMVIFVIIILRSRGADNGKIEEIKTEIQKGSVYSNKLEAYKADMKKKDNFASDIEIDFDKFFSKDEEEKEDNSLEKHQPVKTVKRASRIEKPSKEVQQTNVVEKQGMSLEEKQRRREALLRSWNAGKAKKETKTLDFKNSFKAAIHKKQTLSNGQVVMLRTKDAFKIGILTIPPNTLVNGIVKIAKNRVNIDIKTIRLGKRIIPCAIDVYGSDGIKGLAVNFDNVKEKAENEGVNEIVNQLDAATKGATRILTGFGKSIKNEKEKTVTFLDNQTVYLEIRKTNK